MGQRATSRRGFIRAGALGVPLVLLTSKTRSASKTPAASRIAVGCIGLGMEGMHKNLRNMLGQEDVQVVAVCDVDRSRVEQGAEVVRSTYSKSSSNGSFKGVEAYGDFRELLARKDIDAVVVSTPDHWHVP